MTIEVVTGWDATHSNLPFAPKTGQAAGYDTGSSDIAWTAADYAAHPHAVHIDQDFRASDALSDWIDVETGAATPAEVAGWVERARANFNAAKRPGQRWPGAYVNQSNLTAVANGLSGAKLTDVPIWLADYNFTEAEAAAVIKSASGPYPIVGVQYSDQGGGGRYDLDVWNKAWLDKVSGSKPPTPKAWHEWVTAGDLSLAAFAAKLDVGIATLLENTIKHYGYLNAPLGNYVKGVFNGSVAPTAAMPKGCKFWVFT